MRSTPHNAHNLSLLEVHIAHSTVSMFANPKRFVDPLQTIELDEKRSTTCHENETEKQRAEREARGDLHTAVQSGLNLRIGLSWRLGGLFGRGCCNFRGIKFCVFLW